MLNGIESGNKRSQGKALANIYLLLLTVIVLNHHVVVSQSAQQRKPKSRVVVAAKDIPTTSFTCNDRSPGYYADVETGCQVYHMCSEGGTQFSYRCPNTTLFQQRMLICAHWYQVNCSRSEESFNANLLIGQRDKPFVDESEQVNIYYHGKDLKKLLNPDELQRLQNARSSASGSNGLQTSASEYINPTAGAFSNNFQKPRVENRFTNNQATTKAVNQHFNHQLPGKEFTQFPTKPTVTPFQHNHFNQPLNSFQPQPTTTTTLIPKLSSFNNGFNQRGPPQTYPTTSRSAFSPFNIRTSPTPPPKPSSFHSNNQHTVAHFTTQPQFQISSTSFTSNQPQMTVSPTPGTFTPAQLQSISNQNLQLPNNNNRNNNNNNNDNRVSQNPLTSNLPHNTETSTTDVIDENTYNNFIRRFVPEEDNKSFDQVNITNEYNQFLNRFVPEIPPTKNETNEPSNYNNFLKVFIPDDSTFINSNNTHRQNSKLSTGSNFISQINSLSKEFEPPFASLSSELGLPFEDAEPVGTSMELFKLNIHDPRHAFFIPDNDNEQIPLDSQVTPVTITIQRPGNSRPHPMTFLNIVPDNCYRCHPNFIINKEACTPCVIIR